jgi:hypothetical protein
MSGERRGEDRPILVVSWRQDDPHAEARKLTLELRKKAIVPIGQPAVQANRCLPT